MRQYVRAVTTEDSTGRLAGQPGPVGSERLAIVGAGAIGAGLGATAALHGVTVQLYVRSPASARRVTDAVAAACERAGKHEAAGGVELVDDLDALVGASFVVEAIAEDAGAKGRLLAQLAERLAPDAVLSTTTSSLSVAGLARASGQPERFAALHVFNPVVRMALVELVFPEQATDDTRARTWALCAALGKTAIEVPDAPGFVVNRLLFPFLFEAVRLLESTGMAPSDVDACLTLGAGHPIGPLALLDLVGLDVAVAIGEEIGAEIPARVRVLVAQGALGRKTGHGLVTGVEA